MTNGMWGNWSCDSARGTAIRTSACHDVGKRTFATAIPQRMEGSVEPEHSKVESSPLTTHFLTERTAPRTPRSGNTPLKNEWSVWGAIN